MADCNACGAKIQWLTNEATGKKAPVDIEGDPAGNVVRVPPGHYRVLTNEEMRSASEGLFKTTIPNRTRLHFATCPAAAAFRRCKKCHYAPCRCAA